MQFSKSLIVISLSAALSACGGSSSSDTSVSEPDTDDNTPVTTSVVSEGVITGFGSVYVNGQRYGSQNAVISISDSNAADEAQLKVGMVVKVAASRSDDGSDPEASEISYEEHLQGPVSFINQADKTITVLGQQVVYDNLTEFDGTDIDTLSLNDVIEVSGYATENGDFYATLIELEDDNEIKVKGEVSALDTSAETFVLNGLTINYAGAEFDDMTSDDLVDGFFVKVEGTEYNSDTSTLTATSVENKNDNDIDDDIDEIEIAGIVKDYDAATGSFTLNRYTVVVSDNTEYDDGTVENLANGVVVKVEGQYTDETVQASEVEFKAQTAQTKTEGQVTEVDSDNGTFTVNGLTFTVTESTRYDDESDIDDRQFNFDKIEVNDWLKVYASENSSGNSLVLKVKRIEQGDRDGEVRGAVVNPSQEGMTVAGLSIVFTDGTHFDTEDDRISLSDFLALVEESNALLVEVEGEYEGDVLVAKEVEIEIPGSGNGDDDDRSNVGKVEFKGSVESIEGSSVVVNGSELRFDENSELEINELDVTVDEFIQALSVGSVIEVEGVWREDSFIMVLEAELETDDDDDNDDDE